MALPKDEQDCRAQALFELLPSDKNVSNLTDFFDRSFEEIPPTRLLNHYRGAATLYFLAFISQSPFPDKIEVSALVEDAEKKAKKELCLEFKTKCALPPYNEEIKLRSDAACRLEQLFKCESGTLLGITNLKVFLKETMHRVKQAGVVVPRDEHFLEAVRKNFFRKLVGCGEVCLKCKRVCDKDHETTNYAIDKHECRLSHQP